MVLTWSTLLELLDGLFRHSWTHTTEEIVEWWFGSAGNVVHARHTAQMHAIRPSWFAFFNARTLFIAIFSAQVEKDELH